MKTTVYQSDFVDAFLAIRPDNFSREGLHELFAYFEEYEESTGEEIELDVIAMCCEYTEDSTENIAAAYDIDLSEYEEEEDKEEAVKEYLQDMGVYVGEVAGGFVYRDF